MKKTEGKRLLRFITSIIYAVLIVIIILLVISKITNKTVFVFNRSILFVTTQSMEDTIPSKSFILVKKADTDKIKVGDIITFYSDDPSIKGYLNTHRVINISDDGKEFTTKGDNNTYSDKYTAKSHNVISVYEKNLPVLTAISSVFSSRFGLIFILFIIVLIIIIPNLIVIIKEKNKKDIENKYKDLIDIEVKKLENDNHNTK